MSSAPLTGEERASALNDVANGVITGARSRENTAQFVRELGQRLFAVEAERDAAEARADKAEADFKWMVDKAADEKLPAYRELGARAAAAETRADEAERLLRTSNAEVVAAVNAIAVGVEWRQVAVLDLVAAVLDYSLCGDPTNGYRCTQELNILHRSLHSDRAALDEWAAEHAQEPPEYMRASADTPDNDKGPGTGAEGACAPDGGRHE